VAGAVAAAGAYCFDRFALARPGAGTTTAESPRQRGSRRWFSVALCLGFLAAAAFNTVAKPGIGVVYAKNRIFRGPDVAWSAWNTHSHHDRAIVFGPAFYWGPGRERSSSGPRGPWS
jgi:hypothetical protein